MRDDVEYELAGCTGKEAFDSYGEAHRVQKRRVKRGRSRKSDRERAKMQVYRCRACHSWHIGTKRPEMQKKEVGRFLRQQRERHRERQAESYAT